MTLLMSRFQQLYYWHIFGYHFTLPARSSELSLQTISGRLGLQVGSLGLPCSINDAVTHNSRLLSYTSVVSLQSPTKFFYAWLQLIQSFRKQIVEQEAESGQQSQCFNPSFNSATSLPCGHNCYPTGDFFQAPPSKEAWRFASNVQIVPEKLQHLRD